MKNKMLCLNCEYVGKPKRVPKGLFAIELLLWLCFILPGLCYTIWRSRNIEMVCPKCKQPGMIPLNTPKAQKVLATA